MKRETPKIPCLEKITEYYTEYIHCIQSSALEQTDISRRKVLKI